MDTIANALAADLGGLAVLSTGVIAVLIAVEWVSRGRAFPREGTRKAAHVGSGFVLVATPWLVQNPLSLCLAAVVFAVALSLAKHFGWLPSVNGVARRTDGVVLFPLAASAVYAAADGDPLRFIVPLAVLTISDSAAALVGQRFGRCGYRFGETKRTVEGTVAFGITALAITWIALAVTRTGSPALWPVVATVVALGAAALEAASGRGWDNFTVPLGTWALLDAVLSTRLPHVASTLGPPVVAAGWTVALVAALWLRARTAEPETAR